MSATHPLHGWVFGMWVTIPGRDSLPQAENGGPYYNAVSGDYFATLGMRIIEGRAITDADVAADAKVVVFSEPMARAYWPGESAVGRCVWMDSDSTCTTVIGVAESARERLKDERPRFLSYLPATRRAGGRYRRNRHGSGGPRCGHRRARGLLGGSRGGPIHRRSALRDVAVGPVVFVVVGAMAVVVAATTCGSRASART